MTLTLDYYKQHDYMHAQRGVHMWLCMQRRVHLWLCIHREVYICGYACIEKGTLCMAMHAQSIGYICGYACTEKGLKKMFTTSIFR